MLMRPYLFLPLVLPLAALGGCAGTVNRGVESVKQPVVSRTDYVFDVNTAGDGLAPGEAQRLAGWMDSMKVRYGDRVAVEDPAGGEGVRDQVASAAARFGLLLDDQAPLTGAPIAPGTARVVISRAVASVPNCPDFSNVKGDFNNNTSSNYGCATNSNLAAMVADPLDLVRGEAGADTTDTGTGTRAIGAYRKAAPTGSGGTAIKTESTGGK